MIIVMNIVMNIMSNRYLRHPFPASRHGFGQQITATACGTDVFQRRLRGAIGLPATTLDTAKKTQYLPLCVRYVDAAPVGVLQDVVNVQGSSVFEALHVRLYRVVPGEGVFLFDTAIVRVTAVGVVVVVVNVRPVITVPSTIIPDTSSNAVARSTMSRIIPPLPKHVPAFRADDGLTLSSQCQSLPIRHVDDSAGSGQANARRTFVTTVMFIRLGVNDNYYVQCNEQYLCPIKLSSCTPNTMVHNYVQ